MITHSITHLDDFRKIAKWLETNFSNHGGLVMEKARFENIEWYADVRRKICEQITPVRHEMLLHSEDGFFGMFRADIRTTWNYERRGDPYDSAIFRDLPIHRINASYQYSGGRIVKDKQGRKKEEYEQFRMRVVLFSDDFPELTASERMLSLLSN